MPANTLDNAINTMAAESAEAKYDHLMSGSMLPRGLDFTLLSSYLAQIFDESKEDISLALNKAEDAIYNKKIGR